MKLQEYSEGGFELNEPTYIFNDIYFIETCGACPEQYSCFIIDSSGIKLEVAYVRLRWSRLTCYFPDVHGELIFDHEWNDYFKGCFDGQEERKLYLSKIADAIETELIEIGVNNE